ncbi:helix-hairpin-helix domain-containing protein [Microbacterium sp. zg.Y1090]|uniref:ComEA family DNA-binding protein n=1 Tax=Microbacterium TaxID=33882 RepID=UPI00214BB99D|nr:MULTISPECIES: ComEA family DNA-binding protein [unclassified Microbacterium]MCR2811764.1 helix-hairpin-helix domain-containing protein [Microbacterium sp. zg.Y1084]MCR2818798.1 helix-hairpin-helix domain-containing protein [Microbacterium sp. zg.Y1090]WIM29733.1 ComEA family DNA-binding protein [Microbacterium sp. zg-Y1090]
MGDSSPPSARRRLGVGAVTVVVILALAVTVAIGILRTSTAPVETVTIAQTPAGADAGPSVLGDASAVYVHVSGAVAAPGLYVLESGARVVDAVAAAGGFGADADRAAVNLARPVGDGEQLHVPVVGEAPAAGAAGPAGPAGGGDGRVNLNTADLTALDTLPRIGPALAQRILDWREQNGRFTSIEDLLAVPGIGEKMLAALRDLVTL